MKVLLVNADSKLPNLALMKLSAYHKGRGDQVSFTESAPDIVYASTVFKGNNHLADGLKFLYPDAHLSFGGSGFDLTKKLGAEVEYLKPDYSLYPEMDFSMGFTTRGCIRRCYFCIVPEKEGKLTRWQHPYRFHDEAHSKIMLLDNNWLADKDWFLETSAWIRDSNLKLREGGMDIRLVDSEIAKRLSELKWYAPMHFAFDSDREEDAVVRGIKILKDASINVRNKVSFFVYCHDDDHYESAVARCRALKEHGATPFVMWNRESVKTPRIKKLIRWGTRPWLTWAIDIDEYDSSKEKT